jgi:hypothetical protein
MTRKQALNQVTRLMDVLGGRRWTQDEMKSYNKAASVLKK